MILFFLTGLCEIFLGILPIELAAKLPAQMFLLVFSLIVGKLLK